METKDSRVENSINLNLSMRVKSEGKKVLRSGTGKARLTSFMVEIRKNEAKRL